MTHQHPHTAPASRVDGANLAQMSAWARFGLVLPAIGLIWVVIWLLVRS